MPNEQDWHALLAKQEAQKRETQQRERLLTLPRLRDVSVKAQQVIDHPGWQHFADLLATRMAEVSKARASFAERMVNGSEMGPQLELLKLNVNKCDAELAGLQYAASLIPDAVTLGQKIAGEMNGRDAAVSDT